MSGTASLPVRLESLFGADRVHAADADLLKYTINGMQPKAVLRPANAEEAAEVVQTAAREKLAAIPCGSGSKLGIGMPPQRYDIALDMGGLQEIAHYDPDDLTLSVDSGKSLASLQAVLRAKRQFLPLGVPCMENCTVGGTVASGIDSLLRQQYGTSRDFLIGAEFVDGTGRVCKSGGRVVKNVTGYDIHKLLIGSLGTLAAITRLNFRTFPLPELRMGSLSSFAELEDAIGYRNRLLGSGLPFESVELFNPELAALLAGKSKGVQSGGTELLSQRHWFVYAACSGNESIVRRMSLELQDRAAMHAAKSCELLEDKANLWLNDSLREAYNWLRQMPREVAQLRIVQEQFTTDELKDLLKAPASSVEPSGLLLAGDGKALVAIFLDGGGTGQQDALAAHLTNLFYHPAKKERAVSLLHAPSWLKVLCGVWSLPQTGFALSKRVKAAFDPQDVFAPGRFVGGI
jgi:FAD/FMN-containing dehydrogenase